MEWDGNYGMYWNEMELEGIMEWANKRYELMFRHGGVLDYPPPLFMYIWVTIRVISRGGGVYNRVLIWMV